MNVKAEKVIADQCTSSQSRSWFYYNGVRHKVIKAIEVEENGNPGEIINLNFTIACLHNSIQILELQKRENQKMKVAEYLKGNKLIKGSNVS